MTTIRVLLVDDHRMVRDGLGELLGREADIKVIGSAANGEDAIRLAIALQPDVVVLDVCMPDMNGVETAERMLRLAGPRCRILALSAQGDRPFVAQMLRAGARGFVHKDQSSQALISAIRALMAGETYFQNPQTSRDEIQRALSRRERAVLAELATGARAREAAERLGISPKTFDTYRRRIMVKLGLSGQTELLKFAMTLSVGGKASAA